MKRVNLRRYTAEQKAFLDGCLRRVRAGQCQDALILADYLDDNQLPFASAVRGEVERFVRRTTYWCKADMEEKRLRKWARWQLLTQDCRTLKNNVLRIFGRTRGGGVKDVDLWKKNKHLFDVPELRKEVS